VNIHVSTLSGTGMITARGGAGPGGAGGGGRIAVYYDVLSMATTSIIATGGKTGSTASYNGGAGTVYLKSNMLPHGDLIIDNRSTSSNDSSTPLRAIGSGVISAVTSTSLTNSSAAWTAGALKGLQVNPNTDQAATFTVIDNTATTLYLDPAGVDLTQVAVAGSAYSGVYRFNSMTVLGTSKVRCNDQVAVDSGLTIDGSGTTLVTGDVRANTITLTNGGVLTHGNTTAATTYSLNSNAITLLTIDFSSKIDVTGRGYLGGASGGNSSTTGMTYGNTTAGGSTQTSYTGNGGSYGGLGGIYSGGSVNTVYGDLMNPNEVGSGGGAGTYCYYSCSNQPGGNGGGLVKITAGTLQVDGIITADGGAGAATSYNGGGGSGGGVLISASTLSGSGMITAKGGSGSGGSGGGGRIAVYYADKTGFTGSATAAGGTSSANGTVGTVYYQALPAAGTDQPPTIAITSPAQGSTVAAGSTVTVAVQATDDRSLKHVTLAVSGEAVFAQTKTNVIVPNYSTTFTVPVPSGAITGNAIQLTAIARDWAGNTSQAVTTVSIRDSVPPTVSLASPGQTVPYRSGDVNGEGTATVTAMDNVGIAKIVCTPSGPATVNQPQTFTFSPAEKTVSRTFTFPVLAYKANTEVTLSCSAEDEVMNAAAASIKLAIVEGIPPAVLDAYSLDGTTYGSMYDGVTNVPVSAAINVLVSEALAPSSVSSSSVRLVADNTGLTVAATVGLSADRRTITVTPSATLEPGTVYRLLLATAVTDDAANGLRTEYALKFTTTFGGLVIRDQGSAGAPYPLAQGDYTDITIINSIVLIEGSITAQNVSMTTSTVTASGAIGADSLALAENTVLTHIPSTADTAAGLDINVWSMSIDATSRIDVMGKGFPGGYSGANSTASGLTTGITTTTMTGSAESNGGSYGGLGGIYSSTSGTVNRIYGDLAYPERPGSGGGGYSADVPGGSGGGLVRIYADTLVLEGSIVADGESRLNADGAPAGAGSGGGVSIEVRTELSGSGSISAKGGASAWGGAGGGGRIAVTCDNSLLLPVDHIDASGGKSVNVNAAAMNGGAGTLHVVQLWQYYGDLIIDNRGTATAGYSTPLPGVGSGTIAALTEDSLTDNSAAWIPGSLKGRTFIPNINNGDVFWIEDNDATTIYVALREGSSPLTMVASPGDTYTGYYNFSAVTIRGGARASCEDTLALGSSDLAMDNGTLAAETIWANNVTLANGSLLTHARATTMTSSWLDLSLSNTLTIDSASAIDVTGKGYLGGHAGDNADTSGRTLSNTSTGGSTVSNGGSYAGPGGFVGSGAVSETYGNVIEPFDLGSGGGAGNILPGGNGGGMVKINADSVIIDGSIIADGESRINPDGDAAGAGSGGAIFINVWGSLSGNGTLSARGGTNNRGGAGGGGRIAIIYYGDLLFPQANIAASGGSCITCGSPSFNGGAGTLYIARQIPEAWQQPPGIVIVDNGGTATTNVTPVLDVMDSGITVSGGARLLGTSTEGYWTISGNLTLDNASMIASGYIWVDGDIALLNNSVLTHPGATATNASMLEIEANNVMIDSTSSIDVTGKGYLGGYQGDNVDVFGRTVGNATTGGSSDSMGGSYGGLGGAFGSGAANWIYDNLSNPYELGSGGGGDSAHGAGGNGGGYLALYVYYGLVMDGAIRADGGSSEAGGGSGGGIYIDVETLDGTGSISARGGDSVAGGAGGGGRIGINYYGGIALPMVNVVASGGKNNMLVDPVYQGGAGTIFTSANGLAIGDLLIDNRGVEAAEGSTPLRTVGRGTITAIDVVDNLWYYTLTDVNASWTPGSLQWLRINPNINQDQTFWIEDNDATTLTIRADGINLFDVAALNDTYTGVYQFNQVKVLGKAKARCDDRLIVDNELLIDGSSLTASDVTAGSITQVNGGTLVP